MSTYEELMIILTLGLLIVSILNLENKKSRSVPSKVEWLYNVNLQFAGTGSVHLLVGCLVKHVIIKKK